MEIIKIGISILAFLLSAIVLIALFVIVAITAFGWVLLIRSVIEQYKNRRKKK